MDGKPRLLDQMRERIRLKHYSIRTEHVYCEWVKRFIRFHQYRHPRDMGAAEVEAFLTELAVKRNVSASTQNQALSALLFLYKEVLALDLPWLADVVRAKEQQRLPVVLSIEDVHPILTAFVYMSAPSRRRSSRRCGAPASISQRAATPFAIALPPSYCAEAAIFPRCKRFWAMPMYGRRRSIPMCWVRHLPG
jgi:integrase